MTRGHNISSLKKERNIQWVSASKKVQVYNKSRLTSLDPKEKEVRLEDGWQVSGRSTASLDYLLSK